MKQRYAENFLFPQGKEDFGRSMVFPQGNLHGLGVVDYTSLALSNQQSMLTNQAENIKSQIENLQTQLQQQERPNVLTQQQAIGFLQQQGLYYPELTPEAITATVHAIDPTAYVKGGGTGFGSAEGIENKFNETLAQINNLNAQYASTVNEINQVQANIAYQPEALAIQQDAARRILEMDKYVSADTPASLVAEQWAQSVLPAPAPVPVVVAAAASAAATAATTPKSAVTAGPKTIPAVTTAPPAKTNYKYTLDFYNNEFWFKRNDGVAISNGSYDWKSAELYLLGKYALSDVTITPAAAAQFAKNSGTLVSRPVATSTTVTGTKTTTNQVTGTTTVTNPVTGVSATTNPANGTTTVVSTSLDSGKIALFALLGVLLLRGAVN
jgi:hypothetical protein